MLTVIRKLPVLGAFAVRPRLALAIVLGCVLFFCLPDKDAIFGRMIIGWDFGILFYLATTAAMMTKSDDAEIKCRAAAQDEKGLVIIVMTIAGAVMSLTAIMHDLATAKALAGHGEWGAVGLAGATVLLTWMFMQTIFALHYAHAYYSPDDGDVSGGLEFPGKYTTPDYWDFVYFAFIIGSSTATADINITSREIRRVVTVQSIIVFFYNTAILALAINIGASLVQ